MEFSGKLKKQYDHLYRKYEFRFNVVIDQYEYRMRRKKSKWENYTDRVKNNLLFELSNLELEMATDKLSIFVESDTICPQYNPFEEYFESLEKWDEKKDYIKEMSETVETENPELFKDTLERFLVGTLDCLLSEDAVNDVCLVFQSPQGIGKSRWMRKLLPKQFRNTYLYEGAIDTKSKDDVIMLSQYWFLHLDELESLRTNDISALKSYITRQRISVRKAYGRYKSKYIRRASFLGSVNDDEFLSDMTGNRRWLIFKAPVINYKHKVNADKMWSQAYSLLKNKDYRYWYNIDEIAKLNNRNEQFRKVPTSEEMVLKNFKFNDTSGNGEWLGSTDIMSKIMLNQPQFASKLHSNVVGRVCTKYCKAKKLSGGYPVYWVDYVGIEAEETSAKPFTIKASTLGQSINEEDDLPF
jgi:predicted P-loop ATPase